MKKEILKTSALADYVDRKKQGKGEFKKMSHQQVKIGIKRALTA